MQWLQRLHAAASNLAENTPEIITNPDAARGLEQALIEAMVACLAYGEDRKNSFATGNAFAAAPIWVHQRASHRSLNWALETELIAESSIFGIALSSIWSQAALNTAP